MPLRRDIVSTAHEKPFTCSSLVALKGEGPCKAAFKRKSDLQRHEAIHKEAYLYCRFCTYRSVQASALETHVESIHYLRKLYGCLACNFNCSDASSLSRHIRTSKKHKTRVDLLEARGELPEGYIVRPGPKRAERNRNQNIAGSYGHEQEGVDQQHHSQQQEHRSEEPRFLENNIDPILRRMPTALDEKELQNISFTWLLL